MHAILSDDVHLDEMESALLDCHQTTPGKHERGAKHAHSRGYHNSTYQLAQMDMRRPMGFRIDGAEYCCRIDRCVHGSEFKVMVAVMVCLLFGRNDVV